MRTFILSPMRTVIRYFFRRTFTEHWGDKPKTWDDKKAIHDDEEEQLEIYEHTLHISPNFRGKLMLDLRKCTGCKRCVRACPNKCIEMVLLDPQPEWWEKKRPLEAPQFYIGRCMSCGLCSESCSFDALFHSQLYEGAEITSEGLFYNPERMYETYKKHVEIFGELGAEVRKIRRRPDRKIKTLKKINASPPDTPESIKTEAP